MREVEKEGNLKEESLKDKKSLLASGAVVGKHDGCEDQANRILIHLQENEDEGNGDAESEDEDEDEENKEKGTEDEGKKDKGTEDEGKKDKGTEDKEKKPKLWNAVPDPQAKLWIQIGDFIYFYVVKNNFKNKTT